MIKPALRLTARVVDAATKKPVATVRVTPGLARENQSISWDNPEKRTFHGGAFEWTSDRVGTPLAFLIQSDGCKDLETQAFPTSQTSASETFELTPE